MVLPGYPHAVYLQQIFVYMSQLGGTVGDIESMPFIEAFRQFQFKVKRENFCNIHVSLVPQVGDRLYHTYSMYLPVTVYTPGVWLTAV